MATFNVSGATTLAFTPRHTGNETTSIVFSQLSFNIKRATAFTATDYWRYQNTSIKFKSFGSAVRIRVPVTLKGASSFVFEPNYHNVAKVIIRTWPLSGSNSFTLSASNTTGRTWKQIKNQGIAFAQVATRAMSFSRAKSGSTAIVFTPTNSVKHNYKNMSGLTAITFSGNGTRVSGRALSGVTALVFAQNGTTIPSTPTSAASGLIFAQSNLVRVTKNVSAASALEITNGGYAIV